MKNDLINIYQVNEYIQFKVMIFAIRNNKDLLNFKLRYDTDGVLPSSTTMFSEGYWLRAEVKNNKEIGFVCWNYDNCLPWGTMKHEDNGSCERCPFKGNVLIEFGQKLRSEKLNKILNE